MQKRGRRLLSFFIGVAPARVFAHGDECFGAIGRLILVVHHKLVLLCFGFFFAPDFFEKHLLDLLVFGLLNFLLRFPGLAYRDFEIGKGVVTVA